MEKANFETANRGLISSLSLDLEKVRQKPLQQQSTWTTGSVRELQQKRRQQAQAQQQQME